MKNDKAIKAAEKEYPKRIKSGSFCSLDEWWELSEFGREGFLKGVEWQQGQGNVYNKSEVPEDDLPVIAIYEDVLSIVSYNHKYKTWLTPVYWSSLVDFKWIYPPRRLIDSFNDK